MPTVRPNVLLVIEDQLRHDVVADGELCRTPTLDALRASGAWFRQAYTTAGICSPARGSIFTGLYPHSHGVLNNVHGTDALARNLPREHPTVAEVLRDAGYRTGYVGKWHLGTEDGPRERGFADWRVSDADLQTDGAFRSYWARFSEPARDAVFTRYPRDPSGRFPRTPFPLYSKDPVPEDIVPARAVSDEASSLLRAFGRDEDPFFLVVSFLEPHWPSVLPAPFAGMYDPASIRPWPNFGDSFIDKPRTNLAGLEHFGVANFSWKDWQPVVARYLGAVSFVDDLTGRLLRTLEREGLTTETVVIVTADHGDMTGSHRQFNKGPLMYEEVYRVPLIFRGPGVPVDTTIDALASHVDLLPTILDLCGAEPPPYQGRSLLPLLRQEGGRWRDALMCEFHGDEFGLYSQRMVRSGTDKFVYNPNDIDELYDLGSDPFELHNVADRPDLSGKRRDLEALLLRLMHETDDPLRQWAVNLLD